MKYSQKQLLISLILLVMTIFLKKINLSEKNGFCTETCRRYSTGFQESHSEKDGDMFGIATLLTMRIMR